MSIRFIDYKNGYKIVSVALDESTRENLAGKNLGFIAAEENKLILFPEEVVLSENPKVIEKFHQYNNYDVIEIWENGMVMRKYNDISDDNYFFITAACNSNCVICPSPDISRKNVHDTNVNDLIKLAQHIPSDTPHLTITGGEPFLIGEKIFPFLQYLKQKFFNTEFLFLTNGRVFAVDKYRKLFLENVPNNAIVAIPIHGSCENIHDAITRAKGSFKQTKHGIKQLLKNDIRVEIRLVVNRLNLNDFNNIAEFIVKEFKGIEYVSVIAMEMTGNARVNAKKVWVPYRESFTKISNSLRIMMCAGIDVKLYNFPLCTIEKSFWPICKKSISSEKIRFLEKCGKCKYKNECGGVFAGTYQLEKDELEVLV